MATHAADSEPTGISSTLNKQVFDEDDQENDISVSSISMAASLVMKTEDSLSTSAMTEARW